MKFAAVAQKPAAATVVVIRNKKRKEFYLTKLKNIRTNAIAAFHLCSIT